MNRNASQGFRSAGSNNSDLAGLKVPIAPGTKKNIQPVLDRRKNRSRQNQTTTNSQQREKFLNADVFPSGPQERDANLNRTRNYSAAALTQQYNGSRQLQRGAQATQSQNNDDQKWSSGIQKLMAKVQGLKTDLSGQSNVYLEHPAQFKRKGGLTPSGLASSVNQVIRKGKMQFQAKGGEALDLRPNSNSYIVSTYERQRRRHAPFSMLHPDQKKQMAQTGGNADLQGATSQQFEYLVNKTFLQNENKDLDKQAHRISKLNALCQKVSQNITQLKKECRQGNFDIDPALNYQDGKSQLKKVYGDVNQNGPAQSKETQQMMMTPLEAVTQGINLLYATGPVGAGSRANRLVKSGSGSVQVPSEAEIISALPQINQNEGFEEDYFNEQSGFPYKHLKRRENNRRNIYKRRKRSPSSASPETSPTTMSKSYFTRGPSDTGANMAVRRKRTQSALNKRSRPVAQAARDQNHLSPVNLNLNELHNKSGPMNQAFLSQNRRTQSAIFRPLTKTALSLSKLEQASNHLSYLKSSNHLFGLRPDSSATGGAGQMTQESMIQLLHQKIEKQLKDQPDALKSENDRRSIIDNAIRQLFNKELQKSQVSTGGDQQAHLDNLITKQKQTKLESISESQKRVSIGKSDAKLEQSLLLHNRSISLDKQSAQISIQAINNTMNADEDELMQSKQQQSVKGLVQLIPEMRDKISPIKGGTMKNLLANERRKSQLVTVEVTDVEAESPVPYSRHKTNVDQLRSSKQRKSKMIISCEVDTAAQQPEPVGKQASIATNTEGFGTQLAASLKSVELKQLSLEMQPTALSSNQKVEVMKLPVVQFERALTATNKDRSDDSNLPEAVHRSQTTSQHQQKQSQRQSASIIQSEAKNQNQDLDDLLLNNQTAPMVVPNMQANQNMMFGGEGADQDTYYDDDDYAFKKQRRAIQENRKLTALSYDSAVRTSKVGKGSSIQPILQEKGRPAPKSPGRAARFTLQSSAQADQKLTEMYRNTIDEFKKKLYESKQDDMLSRINEKFYSKDNKKKKVKKANKSADKIPDKKQRHKSKSPRKPTQPKSSINHDKVGAKNKVNSNSGNNSARSQASSKRSEKQKKTLRIEKSPGKKEEHGRSVLGTASAVSLKESELQISQTGSRTQTTLISQAQSNQVEPKKSSATAKNQIKRRQSKRILSGASNRRRMTMNLSSPQVLIHDSNSIQTNNDSTQQPININITPSAQQSPGLTKKKKTKKLIDIIKGYEQEKLEVNLSETEKQMIKLLNLYEKKEDGTGSKNIGVKMIQQFIPTFGGQQQNANNSTATDHSSSVLDKKQELETPSVTGKISLFNNIGNTPSPGVDGKPSPIGLKKAQSSMLPFLPLNGLIPQTQSKFENQTQARTDKVHLTGNVSAKHKFYFDELSEWAIVTQKRAAEILTQKRELLGDFDEKDDPIELIQQVESHESCFVDHPDLDKLYELEHGFKINNSYKHGRSLILEQPWDTGMHSLATKDPRMTRSQPDLFNINDSSSDEDAKFTVDNQDFDVKPAMKVDQSWFNSKNRNKAKYSVKDDLDESLKHQNLQLKHPISNCVDKDHIIDLVNKSLRDEEAHHQKLLSTSQGLIANLYHAECDFMVKQSIIDDKFEQRIDQLYGDNIIPQIEKMGQIARSKLMTKEDVKLIEEEFDRQDAQCPEPSGFIQPIEDLEFVQFDPITEDLPLDCSVEIQRYGFSRSPVDLKLVKIIEKEQEVPVQLLWLLKMDELLKDAISSLYYSPFHPAPILETFKMEFNVLQIDCYRKYLKSLRYNKAADVEHNFDWYRAKLLPGMLQYFNNLAISRQDYQTHLAIRFSRPQMKKAHRESLLNGGQFFKPDWHINSLRDLQILKRSKGMPELVEARRDNALQLYIPHDIGSVTNHFHRGPHLSAYKKDIEKILLHCIASSKQETICSIYTDSDTDSDNSDYGRALSLSSQNTSNLLLERLKKGQSKGQVRQKRPKALRKFEPSISHQLDPIRIRIDDAGNSQQAVILVQQNNEIMDLGRTPIRLHEQFQHLWSHKVTVFQQPRHGPYSLHHSILPDGQSKDDLVNQDFCIYDVIEPVHAPELIQEQQEKHNQMIEARISLFRRQQEGKAVGMAKRLSMGNVNLLNANEYDNGLSPEDKVNSSPSLLEADLDEPKMKKPKKGKGKKKQKNLKKATTPKSANKAAAPSKTSALQLERAHSSDSSQLKISQQRSSVGSRSSANSSKSGSRSKGRSNSRGKILLKKAANNEPYR